MSPSRRITVEYPEFPLTLRNLRLGLAGRLGRPLTQKEAARRAKVSQGHLANVERGHESASQFMLWNLAEAYEVDIQLVRAALRGSLANLDDESRTSKAKPISARTRMKSSKRKPK